MRTALVRWVDRGEAPGDFLQAVIRNDLRNAVLRADSENLPLLPTYLHWLYWNAPAPCSGSQAAYDDWLGKGRDKFFR